MNIHPNPFENFEHASKAVLAYLHQQFGFDLWMMTKTDGEDWIVLQSEDHGYQVKEGTVFKWSDSFCSRMVKGLGPNIAPDSEQITEYALAPIGQQVDICAYVGVPIYKKDGSLFGTLCAIDPHIHKESLSDSLPTIQILSQFLSTLLHKELELSAKSREKKISELIAHKDTLTDFLNKTGWDIIIPQEELSSKQLGNAIHVLMIELTCPETKLNTDIPESVIKEASETIKKVFTKNAILARLDKTLFGIVAVEHSDLEIIEKIQQLQENLKNQNISNVLGYAKRHPESGIEIAIDKAKQNKCCQKPQ